MRQIKFYRTYSYGGMEGRTVETRDFETEKLARENAIQDEWNTNFYLYEMTMTFDGEIKTEGKIISKIICGREIVEKMKEMVSKLDE